MSKVKFLFGIHNHQPVGNFQSVFENCFDRSYYPFLQLLESYPKIRTTIHFSGILLKWIEDNRPDGIDILKRLVQAGQLEMMSGGFYEPILPVIPDRDKLGQIRKLTDYIQTVIGDFPTGMWLAERVWEPHLPKILNQAGVKYTVLDDAHFRYSGLTDDQLNGYYITEDEGKTVALFPISRKLRYTIPFRPIEETLDYLRSLCTEDGSKLAIYADDGEKFGVWPGTYNTCFTEKWLERFFQTLTDNSDWIETTHFREALSKTPAIGRVYLPTASYTEMNEWALPASAIKVYEKFGEKLEETGMDDKYGVFVRGGFWRNFLAKYDETNNMHKKMLSVSDRISEMLETKEASASEVRTAQDYLWRGQCNCPYWHGVFGGLYLPHIRSAIYQNLIMAEKSLDSLQKKRENWVKLEAMDFDKDGHDEQIVETSRSKFYFSPYRGGALFELDHKPSNLNIIDTITRREEGYHHRIASSETKRVDEGSTVSIHDIYSSKESGLDKLLSYDWYRRGCFIDHFFGMGASAELFQTAQYPEEGDFSNSPYECSTRTVGSDAIVTFEREGGVWYDGKHARVHIEKEFLIEASKSTIEVTYRITNRDKFAMNLNFGTELNFGFPNLTSDNVSYTIEGAIPTRFKKTDKLSSTDSVSQFGISNGDDNFLLDVLLQKKATLWRVPIYSVSLSEEGFEKVLQTICIVPTWEFYLAPKESWELKMIIHMKAIDTKQIESDRIPALARI